MRTLVVMLGAAAAVALSTGSAAAQTTTNVPIDTTRGLVQPADTAINIFSGTFKLVNRAVADAVDSNGFVKTINNLLGRTDTKATRQANGLPLPTMYPSVYYKNSFQGPLPTTMQFGTTPGTGR